MTPLHLKQFVCFILCGWLLCGCAIGKGSIPPTGSDLPGKPYTQAGEFVIAPEFTAAKFEVAVVDIVSVKGEFRTTSGQLVLGDDGRPSRVDVTIETASADTGLEDVNEMVRGAKFFNAEKFPTVAFRSSSFKTENQQLTGVEGTLTVLGVTRNVMLKVDRFACRENEGRAFCTSAAATTIKRSDFGMTTWSESVGDEIKIEIRFTAYQRL